jgi:hypothetical protein
MRGARTLRSKGFSQQLVADSKMSVCKKTGMNTVRSQRRQRSIPKIRLATPSDLQPDGTVLGNAVNGYFDTAPVCARARCDALHALVLAARESPRLSFFSVLLLTNRGNFFNNLIVGIL